MCPFRKPLFEAFNMGLYVRTKLLQSADLLVRFGKDAAAVSPGPSFLVVLQSGQS